LRDGCDDDAVLLKALRILAPRYSGPSLRLYRGDGAANRRRRTYGLSWSLSEAVADSFAQGYWRTCSGGSVLLSTEAPREAILCAVHQSLGSDRYGEDKYLLDRRRLQRVEVTRRYAQTGPHGRAALERHTGSAATADRSADGMRFPKAPGWTLG
jgi:hypothetical protein